METLIKERGLHEEYYFLTLGSRGHRRSYTVCQFQGKSNFSFFIIYSCHIMSSHNTPLDFCQECFRYLCNIKNTIKN